MKSTALVNYSSEPRSVELREAVRPEPGAEVAILAMEAVGVCGRDLRPWTGSASWKANYPAVLGREFSGSFAALGSAVLALLGAGQFDLRPIMGGDWTLEAWPEAFEKMHAGEIVMAAPQPV
ncbi:MAG: hypothetical protein EXS39_05560 [Opitutaceae bacterium]|nr:hypothetical protein [Opitutaceae bacterium]